MAYRTILHVSGFPHDLRAKDLAWEFERYGRLVRCDIPALRPGQTSPFAFVEFRRPDDAEDAYYDMHGRFIEGRRVSVQWAKRPPSTTWRNEGPRRDPPPRRRSPSPPFRRRSPSPRREDDARDRVDRRRSLSPRRDNRDDRDARPAPSKRSPSPAREPKTNGASHDHEQDRARDAEDDRERRDD